MTYLFSLALGFISLCLPVERLLAHADRRRRRTVIKRYGQFPEVTGI
jgi:hypothetical protein